MNNKFLDILHAVAIQLGELNDEIVYVGGAVVSLYDTNKIKSEARFTEDIDLVVKISSYSEYNAFQEKLRGRGFEHDMRKDAPIIRFVGHGVTIDAIPMEGVPFGFKSECLKRGAKVPISYSLNSIPINILPPAYFLATKMEALHDRGRDLRTSKDFEDVVFLLLNRSELMFEFEILDNDTTDFLLNTLMSVLTRKYLREEIECVLPSRARVEDYKIVLEKMDEILKRLNKTNL